MKEIKIPNPWIMSSVNLALALTIAVACAFLFGKIAAVIAFLIYWILFLAGGGLDDIRKAISARRNDKFTAQVGDFVFEKKPPSDSENNFRRILETGKELPPNPMQKEKYKTDCPFCAADIPLVKENKR